MKIVSEGKHIRLRLVRLEDAEFILSLRCDPDLSKWISQVENDLSKQKRWIIDYKNREKQQLEFYFIVESLDGDSLGTARVYDLKKDSFSWGSWIIKKGSPAYVAIESALCIYDFGYLELGFEKCHFDVENGNKAVRRFHEGLGARFLRSSGNTNYFSTDKTSYIEKRVKYRKYLNVTEEDALTNVL